jgi:hypothetical protein
MSISVSSCLLPTSDESSASGPSPSPSPSPKQSARKTNRLSDASDKIVEFLGSQDPGSCSFIDEVRDATGVSSVLISMAARNDPRIGMVKSGRRRHTVYLSQDSRSCDGYCRPSTRRVALFLAENGYRAKKKGEQWTLIDPE